MSMSLDLVCGVKKQSPGYRFETADYDHFQLIVVQSGTLHANLGGGVQRLGLNSYLVLPPGSAFSLWCEKSGYRGISVNSETWPTPERDATAHLCDGGMQQLAELIERVLVQSEPGSAGLLCHLGAALCEWAVNRRRASAGGQPEDNSAYWAERTRVAIENHLHSDLPVAGALAGLGLCYRQLARHFEHHFGTSPKRYQLTRRIEEARKLLLSTDLSVTTVALELGFASSQHFASRFREVTGKSPTESRNRE